MDNQDRSMQATSRKGGSGLNEPAPQAATQAWVSILFPDPVDAARAQECGEPGFFSDVFLDQVVDALTQGRREYQLTPYFYAPLRSVQDIDYRQQVFRDLDGTPLAEHVARFGHQMAAMRRARSYADGVRDAPQVARRWVLDGANTFRKLGSHVVRHAVIGVFEICASRDCTVFGIEP